jgi:porphobilinogen synthase
MIKAAELMGWVDGQKMVMETLLSIKRAGADMILTYSAVEAAKAINAREY